MTTKQRNDQIRADAEHVFPARRPAKAKRRGDRAERFVDLIRLLARGGEWAARRLSQELEVTVRTVHRDMKVLEAKGLATRTRGPRSSYQFVPDASWERPQLTVRELIALVILSASAESNAARGGETALDATTKIVGFQPAKVSEPLLGFLKLFRAQDPAMRQWLGRQRFLATILEALVENRPLQVRLAEPAAEGAAAPLTVVPSGLAMREGQWVLSSHRVSPAGGSLTLELARMATVDFDR